MLVEKPQKLTRFRQLRGRCDGIGIEFRIEFKIGITAVENTRRTLNESPRLDFDTGTYAMAIVSVCMWYKGALEISYRGTVANKRGGKSGTSQH